MTNRTKIKDSSGVIPIPIYTKPYNCGGHCIYCPEQTGIPKSYIENEDTLFAKQCNYSPSIQFNHLIGRLYNYDTNLPVELIILGGSFSSLNHSYRMEFLSDLYTAMSNSNAIKNGINYLPSIITVESRPDQINYSECVFLRKLGVSKVELGIQHTCDRVLNFNNRGHHQNEIINATKLLKREGFKVGYHIMLGLPGATIEDDLKMLTSDIWLSAYSPDYLKIYPCILLKNPKYQPKLYKLYKTGEWIPRKYNEIIYLLKSLRDSIPSYVRISRIQRQFKQSDVLCGLNPGLRVSSNIEFKDIRSREIGLNFPNLKFSQLNNIKEKIIYNNNDVYIELIANNNILLGITRLYINDNLMILRELKIYGKATPLGHRDFIQGNGLGERLLKCAENLSIDLGLNKMFVNASPGARPYFLNHGYFHMSPSFLMKDLPEKRYNKILHADRTTHHFF